MAWQKKYADDTALQHAVAMYVFGNAKSLTAAFKEALSHFNGMSRDDREAALQRLQKAPAEAVEGLLEEAREKRAKGWRYARPSLLNGLKTPAEERRVQAASKLMELARQCAELASRLESAEDGEEAEALLKEGMAILRGVGVPDDAVSEIPNWIDPDARLSWLHTAIAAAAAGAASGYKSSGAPQGTLLTGSLNKPTEPEDET